MSTNNNTDIPQRNGNRPCSFATHLTPSRGPFWKSLGCAKTGFKFPTSKPSSHIHSLRAYLMATLTLQRASWCLQISRTSRTFAVSFTTALPHRGKPRRLPQDFSNPRRETSNPLHSSREDATRRSARHVETRRAFTSTRVYRAQQEAASPASKSTSLDAQPPQATETISPDAPDLTSGLNDQNVLVDDGDRQVDWTRSFHGLSTEAFSPEAAKTLLAPIEPDDIEVKPDGIIYLPEIKYRRILNQAFGPGGWGLAPRGETIVTAKAVTREYALIALGRYTLNATFFSVRSSTEGFFYRLVSVARGEQDYFSPEGIPTAVEGCKSTALRRCCKDLGVASELWDPRFIRKFLTAHVKEIFVEHQVTKKRKKIYLRKDDVIKYPYKEMKYGS